MLVVVVRRRDQVFLIHQDDSDLGTDSGGSAKPAETQMWLLVGFISLGFC